MGEKKCKDFVFMAFPYIFLLLTAGGLMVRVMVFLFVWFSSIISYAQGVSGAVASKDHVDLSNTTWEAISIGNLSLDKRVGVVIHFGSLAGGKGRVSGTSGCNQFSGQYYLSYTNGGQTILGFSQLASTRMACLSKQKSEAEKKFLETLPFIQSFSMVDGKLILQTMEGQGAMILVQQKGK